MYMTKQENYIIEAWNKTHNAKEIAECFFVNTSVSDNS